MRDTSSIFARYEAVRARFPTVSALAQTKDVTSLIAIAEGASAFVFDAFGVLNVGDTPIPGAAGRLDQLRNMGCAIRILTNAASYDRVGAIKKFEKLGIGVDDAEIITSRDATLGHLSPLLWGCIAAPDDELGDIGHQTLRLLDDPLDYARVEGFLFLSSAIWTDARQDLLARALADRDRPVLIANADLVAPRGDGFSLEPGHFGHLLVDQGAQQVRFFGKPFPEVFALAEASLPGVLPEQIVMSGDTLHTDILGAAARGWQTAFITQDGLFAGHETDAFITQSGLHPTWRMPRI